MARARARILLDKAIAAMIAAIEVYNKPDFKYREETFSVLALNAWELLLKAKVLCDNANKLSSIYAYERKSKPGGGASKKRYIKRNRAGNPMTVGVVRALTLIDTSNPGAIEPTLRANLDALMEIRDNAVHFANEHVGLAKAVQELGTASVQNFVAMVQKWFARDLSEYNFYLMPLAFFRGFKASNVVTLTSEERRLIQYVAQLHTSTPIPSTATTAVLMEMKVTLKRTPAASALRMAVGNDPNAISVAITEEDIRTNYPWDYKTVREVLRDRYSDFKENSTFHRVRKPLLSNPSYVMSRYLDPGNPKSQRKDFYSRNVLNEFDKHYVRKK